MGSKFTLISHLTVFMKENIQVGFRKSALLFTLKTFCCVIYLTNNPDKILFYTVVNLGLLH
jgi:hypothetical protein